MLQCLNCTVERDSSSLEGLGIMTEEPVAREFYEKLVKQGQNMATLERIELRVKTPIKSKKALLVYHGMYERNPYWGLSSLTRLA